LRAKVEQLNADLAQAKFAEGAACGYCSHSGSVLLAKIERLQEALPNPVNLRLLADWFDLRETSGKLPERYGSREVQKSLRDWADRTERAIRGGE
jgi:hypothetical protein